MPEIVVGCAVSDVNDADLPLGLHAPERLADYVEHMRGRVGGERLSIQLQPEEAWTKTAEFPDKFAPRERNNWRRAFQSNPKLQMVLAGPRAITGVHQPLEGCDVLSSNFFRKYRSIEEIKAAMQFADRIAADYFVLHMAQVDKWNWPRRDQQDKALKISKVLATFYHTHQMTFVPCLELLEYPKFPATGGELYELLDETRRVWPEMRVAFDISHLYGSRERMIAAGALEAQVPFIEMLNYALEQTWANIHVFQLGGCWESETHAVPGLHPQQDPFRYPLKLRESPGTYAEMGEIDLNAVLDLIIEYSVRKDRDLNLVLEIFDRDIDQVVEAVRLIRDDLLRRANQPPVEHKTAPRLRGEEKGSKRTGAKGARQSKTKASEETKPSGEEGNGRKGRAARRAGPRRAG